MDKKDLRYAFLNYFRNQIVHNQLIECKALLDIGGNPKVAKDVLEDLIKDNLIERIEYISANDNSLGLISNEPIKLTEKGYKELLNQVESEQLTEIAKSKALSSGSEFNSSKMELLTEDRQQIITKINKLKKESKDNAKKLSTEEKYRLIKKEILVFFYELSLEPCLLFDDNGELYSLYKIRGKLNEIALKYFKTSGYHLKYILNKCLFEKGLIEYRYGNEYVKNNEEIGIKNFITNKGIKYLEEEYSFCPNKTLGELTEKEYISTYGNIVPRISSTLSKLAEGSAGLSKQLEKHFKLLDNVQKYAGLNSTALKLAQQWENSPSLKVARQVEGIYSRIVDEAPYLKAAAGIQNLASSSTQKASDIFFQDQNLDNKDLNEENKESNLTNNKFYIFEGILGQNCGDYVTINDYNKDDRLPERITKEKTGRHFIVKNGIKVLRGFAKASDLYLASEPDKKNYQRNEDDIHLKELANFIDEMNPSGKYLPELTFIARGGYELHRPDWGNKLQATQLGYFKNTNYYQLHLNGTKLYRIDGNHRLKAMQRLSAEKDKEYYVPFAIILMGKQVLFDDSDQMESSLGLEFSGNYGLADDKDEKKIVDMEAFLFYFLNAKAKRLTTEENYRGLINSNWEEHEIMIANKNIILLQHLEKIIKDDILHNDFCDNQPLKQISEILDKINENIELKEFKKIIKIMNNLLAKDCWNNLKKFDFYCQLIFYVSYKHKKEGDYEQKLNNLEHWVQKYDFDNTTFDNPILLYNNAEKTNNIDPIDIFVAMPFDETNIDNFTEWIGTAIKNIEAEKPKYKNKLNLHKIMTHRGYNIDLIDDIMDKINNCSIFIAEISPCKFKIDDKEIMCDANPNVMYELGIAYNLKKPIILMREGATFSKVPSDIQEKYRNMYSRDNTKEAREILQKSIKAVIEDYYDKPDSI